MKGHRFVPGLVALVVSGVAGAAVATSEHAHGVATQAELARMEKDQAERTSPWGGGYIPENHGKFVQDGREWEIIDSVTVSVVLNQTCKGDGSAGGPDAHMPFRIPTTGWYNCEDDPTKAPTCARTL